jgi:hypothetical protein
MCLFVALLQRESLGQATDFYVKLSGLGNWFVISADE